VVSFGGFNLSPAVPAAAMAVTASVVAYDMMGRTGPYNSNSSSSQNVNAKPFRNNLTVVLNGGEREEVTLKREIAATANDIKQKTGRQLPDIEVADGIPAQGNIAALNAALVRVKRDDAGLSQLTPINVPKPPDFGNA
jgi:hypothetical protein